MINLLIYLPFLAPVLVAQFEKREIWPKLVTYGLLVALNLGILGIAAFALLSALVTSYAPDLVPAESLAVNWPGVALAAFLTALAAFLPLLPAVRRGVSRLLPIDPDSAIHTTALTLAVYQIGLSLAQMALIGDLENLTESGLGLTLWDVVFGGVPLALFALAGVGLFIRRDGRSTLDRLGLRRLTWRQLAAAVGITLLFLALDFAVNLAWQEMDPAGYDVLDRVIQNLFGGLVSVVGALALGLSAGISEELLFRGAVQPRLGLLLTSVLFAIGHLQYGLTPATLEVFVIGLVLGLVRNRASTTLCILIHASYNAAGVLLGMWQP